MSAESESLLVIGGIFGVQFYVWYAVIASCGLLVGAVLAWHRKSLHDHGIDLFKQRRKGAARS